MEEDVRSSDRLDELVGALLAAGSSKEAKRKHNNKPEHIDALKSS